MTEPRDAVDVLIAALGGGVAYSALAALAEHGYQITKAQAGVPRLVASDAIPEDEVWFIRGRRVVGKITGLAAAEPTDAEPTPSASEQTAQST